MLLELVFLEVVGVKVLAVSCKESLGAILDEIGGENWKVWQENRLHFACLLGGVNIIVATLR